MTPLNPKLYDKLKFLAQIGLPALGTLYVTLSALWGLPSAEAVAGSVLAVDTFLGAILQLSSSAYKNSDDRFDGSIDALGMSDGGDVGNFTMSMPLSAEELEGKDEVVLKVNPPEVAAKKREHKRRS